EIRYAVVRSLAEHVEPRDLPILLRALHDDDPTVGLWAFRGIVRMHSANRSFLRRWMNQRRNGDIAEEAQLELARKGDSQQLARLVDWIGRLGSHGHDREGWGSEEMAAEDVLEILADRRPPRLAAALHRAAENSCEDIRR